MKKEFAEKWADALESGEYKQGKGKLFDGQSYCCLGVACVLAGRKFEESEVWNGVWVVENTLSESYLPEDVKIEIEMKHGTGSIFYNGRNTTLADLNDNGLTFTEIAKIIRDRWEVL